MDYGKIDLDNFEHFLFNKFGVGAQFYFLTNYFERVYLRIFIRILKKKKEYDKLVEYELYAISIYLIAPALCIHSRNMHKLGNMFLLGKTKRSPE